MAYEDGKTPVKGPFADLIEKLQTRTKLQGALLVTFIILVNTWLVLKKPLDQGELTILAGIWGVYNLAEGYADGQNRK